MRKAHRVLVAYRASLAFSFKGLKYRGLGAGSIFLEGSLSPKTCLKASRAVLSRVEGLGFRV